jgi:hypothetical protein
MVLVILALILIAISALLQTVGYIIKYFPYVSGCFYGTLLLFLCKPLSLIIPEHKWLSRIIILTVIEIIIFILLHIEHTKKATIAILCVLAPAYFMTIFQIEVASWQMALFLSILHIVVFGLELLISLGKYEVNIQVRDGFVTTIFNSIAYSAAIGMIVYSIFYCYWELYMGNVGRLNIFRSTRIISMIIAIVIAFIVPILSHFTRKLRR